MSVNESQNISSLFVIPAKAGIQDGDDFSPLPWTPAFAGVTGIILI
jgi:hypothetical protein